MIPCFRPADLNLNLATAEQPKTPFFWEEAFEAAPP
jgi:hypothetical protein